MDNKHTEGPWHQTRSGGETEPRTDVYDSNSRIVACCRWYKDAALIAAAPDLLAALEGLLKATRMAHGWAQNCGPQYADDYAVFVGEWIDEARAAIAKATQP